MSFFRKPRFREDDDLAFLQLCEDNELELLVDVLAGPEDDRRLTEELSGHERFRQCCGAYSQVWDLIAAELQTFGADSGVTAVRGHGVAYREVLCDVCDTMGARFSKDDDTVAIERALMLRVAAKAAERMGPDERQTMAEALGMTVRGLSGADLLNAIRAQITGSRYCMYLFSQLVAFSATRVVAREALADLVAPALATRLSVLAGPLGWGLMILLAVPMVTGPAYRVTGPACLVVAHLRQRLLNRDFV